MKNTITLIYLIIALLMQHQIVFSQTNHSSNISSSGTSHAEPLGWITGFGSVSNDVDIDNNFSTKSINLSTYNGSLIKRMTILSTGLVGIGNFTPDFLLDVNSGDINLHTFTNSYRIGDGATGNSFPVLWHNGDISSIFVGVGAVKSMDLC